MPEEEKTQAIAEFSFAKGILVATFSGILSACFAFALTAGNPIGDAAKAAGTAPLWSGLPKLVIVLLGGFTTNFIWCALLNIRNGTGYQYFSGTERSDSSLRAEELMSVPTTNSASEKVLVPTAPMTVALEHRVPLLRNYFFSALAGTTWYFQFFFYTMGESQMGKFGFASWTLHMASIIIFSTIWGWFFHEWKGSSRRAHVLIASGIATLILSTIIIGFGTWLKGRLAAVY